MAELICHFHDYLSALPQSTKLEILREAEVEIVTTPKEIQLEQHSQTLNTESYRDLIVELRRSFGHETPTALSALLVTNPEAPIFRRMPETVRKAIFLARELGPEAHHQVPSWALNPSNWFLINSDRGPFTLQSEISSRFPCMLFENGPIECAAPKEPNVDLVNLEEILQATGIYSLWEKGHFGDDVTISVLDTGVSGRGGRITKQAVGGMSPDDRDGHGTAIIELISTLCPNAQIESIRIMEYYSGGQIWNLVSGLTDLYRRDERIVNMSLTVTAQLIERLGPQATAFRESISNLLRSLGARRQFPICASGNDSLPSLRWPAASVDSLAVGSHNAIFERSSFSNHQLSAENFVLAPGGDSRQVDRKVFGFGRYGYGLSREVYGTSFSTAVVSALSALLMACGWFQQMDIPSRISLFRNHCRRNSQGFPIINVADIGAVWPLR